MKSKEKERTSIRTKESLYKELLNEYSNADEKYPKRIDAVDKEMNQILQEKMICQHNSIVHSLS